MIAWLIATVGGVALALLSYRLSATSGAIDRASFALRAFAWMLLLALLFDAPRAPADVRPRLLAIDVSASNTRGRDPSDWAANVARIAADFDDRIIFGDSARAAPLPQTATDSRSTIAQVAERAALAGAPVVVLTDGEIDDPERAADLPAGSEVRIVRGEPRPDRAVRSIEAPPAIASGDSMDIRIALVAGEAGTGPGELRILLDDRVLVNRQLDAAPAYDELLVTQRVIVSGDEGDGILRAVVVTPLDAEPRNDTLGVPLAVARLPQVVMVSTAPDYDSRLALPVLRAALQRPVAAFWRVTPGQWRIDGTLAPVEEARVAAAVRGSAIAVIHGDTGFFGAPRQFATGSLLLHPTLSLQGGDWYASGAPPSPLSPALAELPWDSLPPLQPASAGPAGSLPALEARLARRGDPRSVVVLDESPRRVAIVGATGFWRWGFRPGVSREAFAAFWGSVIDWLAAGRPDRRAAVPTDGVIRAGEPLRWRRGGADSVVTIELRQRGDAARIDSMTVRFVGGATVATTPPLEAGIYEAVVPGGAALVVVNHSRELVPRRPTMEAGPTGAARRGVGAPGLRDTGVPFALLIAVLCAEWILRRRRGYR